MTKSFLVFLTGTAGAGLLLLRLVVAVFVSFSLPEPAPNWQHAGLIILVISLMTGFLTRYSSAMCAVLLLLIAARSEAAAAAATTGLHGVTAIALSLLGPGGYSMDSQVYGPRVIKLED